MRLVWSYSFLQALWSGLIPRSDRRKQWACPPAETQHAKSTDMNVRRNRKCPNSYRFRGSHLSTMVRRNETNAFNFLLSFAGGGCHLFAFQVVSLGPARLRSIPCTCADQGALSPATTGEGVLQGPVWPPHVFPCRFALSVFCWLLLFCLSTVFPLLMSW